ncbi:glycoside hydrolase family 3 N-terminal domain-containing protein [Microbacterium sp. YY-01]|uniref:glycoside hydrolase family 3 N-terminal domain-containing protein n=1 Tax=Microbacterium sp. YY-01 TaxID=3421634 RepID=UPI003D16DA83
MRRIFRTVAVSAAVLLGFGIGVPDAAPATAAESDAIAAGDVHIEAETRDDLRAHAESLVAELSVEEQAAMVVMGHISTTDPDEARQYMSQGWGGFLLMGANIPADEEQLRALTKAIRGDNPLLPALVAIDQEGGDVSRLPWDVFASAQNLKGADGVTVEQAFSARAAVIARDGITVNFGTVADVPASGSSFIYGRALGTNAGEAGAATAAATRGQEPFVASTLKHFPGHGAAEGDSHDMIPTTTLGYDDWFGHDGQPFVDGVRAGASLLMVGHLEYSSVDAQPASLSPQWYGIAREALGFDGVLVTDDLGMLMATGEPALADPTANAARALAAGADIVLTMMGTDATTATAIAQEIAASVDRGEIPAERLRDAATRVTMLRLQVGAADASRWQPVAE